MAGLNYKSAFDTVLLQLLCQQRSTTAPRCHEGDRTNDPTRHNQVGETCCFFAVNQSVIQWRRAISFQLSTELVHATGDREFIIDRYVCELTHKQTDAMPISRLVIRLQKYLPTTMKGLLARYSVTINNTSSLFGCVSQAWGRIQWKRMLKWSLMSSIHVYI